MNISWITLRDLEYLVAVAKYRHFGKAAESCHVSQPTLSAQIKKIEGFFDLPLFERSNRRVFITEAGMKVTQQAKRVLEEAQKMTLLLKDQDQPLSGTFRLGAIATLGPYLIPRFLSPLRRDYSALNLVIREGLTDPLLKELKEGNLDAVLLARTFDEAGFKVFSLFFEPFVLAAPIGHPLSQKKQIRASDLKTEEMVLLEDGHCLRDQAVDTCPSNRRGHIRQFHATSIETLRHLVASGLGYSLFPKLAVTGSPLKDLIAYRDFDQAGIGREIVLACRERYPGMADVERLAQLISKAYRP